MDPENSLSRVERTLWTVWCYITEAVSRFIRPQPADIVNNDPNSNQESAADIKHPHSDSTDGDTCNEGVDEEQPAARSSLLSSSRPVVTWEPCSTDLGSDEESMRHNINPRKGNESKEDGESIRDEQHIQTENDHSNDLRAKEDKQETMDMENAELATPEDEECERVDTGPQNLTEVALSQERTEEEQEAKNTEENVCIITNLRPEEEDHRHEGEAELQKNDAVTLDDHPREDETIKENEEDDKTHHEEEQDLEAEDTETKVCRITSLSAEDDYMKETESEVQQKDAMKLDEHPGKGEMIKQTQLKEEDDQMQHEEEQDLEAETTKAAEEDNKTHHEDKQDLEAENTEVKVCRITSLSPEEEDHIHEGGTEAQKKDAVTLDDHPREDETIKETKEKEEDDQMQHEEEQDLEAESTEIKVGMTTYINPVMDIHMQEIEAEAEKNNAVTLDDHPREDETIKENEEDDKTHHEEEQDLEAEDTETKVCRITSLSAEDDYMKETESEVQQKDAMKLDEHPGKGEMIKQTQLKEEDDQMQHEEEQDLEAETTETAEEDNKTHHEDKQDLEAENTEVKVCRITRLCPEDDDHRHELDAEAQTKDAVTLDDHPREDETIKETKEKEEDDQMQHEEEQDLEAENTEVKVCRITSLSPEEEDHIREGDTEAQKKDAVTLDDHPREDETIKETKEKEEDDQMQHEEEQDMEAESTEIKVCTTTYMSPVLGVHMQEIEAEAEKNNAVTLDDHPREDETIKENEEDDKTHHEEEQDLEAEDTEAKVCRITSLSPEDDDHMQKNESEVQQNDAVTLDEHPTEDKVIKETPLNKEDDQMQHEEEQNFETENTEVKVCRITSLSPEEEDHIHEGGTEAQKKDAVTLDDHPREDETIKETKEKEEDDQMQHEEEQDLEAESTEIKVGMTTYINPVMDIHMQEIEAEAEKNNAVTLDDHPREDETIKENEEDDKTHHEEEQDLEAEDTETKVCRITSLSAEDDYMKETESEVQQKDAMKLDEHPGKGEMIKQTQLKEEDDQMQHEEEQDLEAETTETAEEDNKTHHEDKQDLEAENTEVKVCRITRLCPEDDDHRHELDAEAQTKDAVTLDDHPREDETIKETKEKEEDDQMQHEEEQDLEAENTEVKVCRITSLSPEEEDHIREGDTEAQKKDAVTLDDHPREDETIKETKEKEEDDQMQHEEEQDMEAESTEIKVCTTTYMSPVLGVHMQEIEAEAEKNNAVTLDDHPREDETIKENEEDDKTHHEEEQDLEAEDTEAKVCRITSLSPEDDDHMQKNESEVQQNDAVTLDEHPTEDKVIKETPLNKEDDQMQHEEEQNFETENTEVKVCRITSLSPEEEDHIHEGGTEAQKKDAVTLDDHPREDETIKETKEKEEDDQMQHEEEHDLEAESTEIKVGMTTDINPLMDVHMQEIEAEAEKNNAVTLDDHPREDETIKENEEDDKIHHEEEQDLEAEICDAILQLASENVKKSDEITNQALFGELLDASVDKPILVRQYPVMAPRSENEEGEKEKASETEQHVAIEKENIDEAAANKTIEDKNIRTVAEGSEGENVLTDNDACSKEAAQESIAQLHTAEFADKEKKYMGVQAVQTKTGQAGVTIADILVDERLVDQDQEKELSISKETYTEECSKEVIHSRASVTVKPESETVQETSEEFKNIPLEISEGQFAMPQELNTPTCEEIQEGVSKYNNELWGVDENTTQRFLEAGDCEEIPATQLPEEVESGEWESLQNTGCSTGADYLLLKESMEEKQESKEETETSFDLVGEENSEILDLAREAEKTLVEGSFQELEHLLGKEEGNLLAGSMKTELTEAHVGLADETERRSEGLHDGAKGSLFAKEANATGGDCEEAVAATEVVRFVIQESVQAINLVESISGPSSLQEDVSESGFMRHSVETEPKSVDDSTVEMQDKAIKREEVDHGDEEEEEEEEADNGTQSTNEMENLHPQVTETAGELIAEESPLNAESELSQDSEPQEIKNQSPDRACEISETQIIETETADESRPVMSSEVKSSSTSGHQDVIDEEILDLWIETAMSEDTDDIKQDEPEPGQLLDAETDTLNEERGDLSLQKELLAKSISGESEVASDTEMSSSTVESGFLGQSLSDSGTQSSEAQPLKSTSTGSRHWIHDMVANMSADIPGVAAWPQPQSEIQDVLMEESAEPEKESITDTLVQLPEGRHLDQESQEKAGEERVERVETESGSQKAYEDVGEALKKVEDEEECLDSLDELKPTESEQPESDSQGESWAKSEKNTLNLSSLDGPRPGQSQDLAESSLPGLNKAEVAEEPTVKSEDKNEVDAPGLDFAMQRSRIAVKNPRVRPPKNPRSLLHMPSAEPTPPPSSRLPVKVPGGVPLGGMGIGIKLPGLGAGLPVLKKRQPAVREENTQETVSQEPETKPEERSEAPQQDETPKKPKWMPPKHPGFGNPLMAELKTKLKKTPKE